MADQLSDLLPNLTLTYVWGQDSAGTGGKQAVASGFRVLAQSSVPINVPADTTEDVLATIAIDAGAMGANGRLRITTMWSATNNANAKSGRIRLGGIGGTIFGVETLTSFASVQGLRQICNRNSQASQVGGQAGASGGFGGSGIALGVSAIDTSLATTLVITGQKATSGDTLTLEAYCVELFYQG